LHGLNIGCDFGDLRQAFMCARAATAPSYGGFTIGQIVGIIGALVTPFDDPIPLPARTTPAAWGRVYRRRRDLHALVLRPPALRQKI
jgi:hypothetical protein